MSKHEKEDGKNLREKFNLRAKPGQVIPYSQADDDLRDRMKTLMKPIKAAPDSFEALMGYGLAPLDKLGRVAIRLISVQEKFNPVADRFGAALNTLQNGPDDAEMKSIGQSISDGLAKEHDDSLTEEEQDSLDEEQENLIDKLQLKMVTSIQKSVEELKATDKELEQLLDESRRVQRQRRDASREIGLHIGAAERLSEKFEGKFLKRAVKKFSRNWDLEGKQSLKDIFKRGEDFSDRVAMLEDARAASFLARNQLSQMRDTMQSQRTKIAEVLNEFENEWKPLLQSTSINPFAPKP